MKSNMHTTSLIGLMVTAGLASTGVRAYLVQKVEVDKYQKGQGTTLDSMESVARSFAADELDILQGFGSLTSEREEYLKEISGLKNNDVALRMALAKRSNCKCEALSEKCGDSYYCEPSKPSERCSNCKSSLCVGLW